MLSMVQVVGSSLACEIPYGLAPSIIMTNPTDEYIYGNETTLQWIYHEEGLTVPSSACVINFTMYYVDGDEFVYIENDVGGTLLNTLPTSYVFDIPEDAAIGDTYTFEFDIYFNMTIEGQLYRDNLYHSSFTFEYAGDEAPVQGSWWDKVKDWWNTYKWWLLGILLFLIAYSIYNVQLKKARTFQLQKEQYKALQYNPSLLTGGGQVAGIRTYGDDKPQISSVGFPKECEDIDILMDKESAQGKFCRNTYKNIFGKYPDEEGGLKETFDKIGDMFRSDDKVDVPIPMKPEKKAKRGKTSKPSKKEVIPKTQKRQPITIEKPKQKRSLGRKSKDKPKKKYSNVETI
jgi:preprotein translocase subunit YajC